MNVGTLMSAGIYGANASGKSNVLMAFEAIKFIATDSGDLKEGKIVCKFSTGGHSGVMVPVYAFGPGAQEFTGIFENTAIFDKIKKLLNL